MNYVLFWSIHVNSQSLFFIIKKTTLPQIVNIERNECLILHLFLFKFFIYFWRVKGKLNFIKSPIHAFQTRINRLSFHFCRSFDSVIMEQQFCDLSLPLWAADCIPQVVDMYGMKVIVSALWKLGVQNPCQLLSEYQKRHTIHPAPPFTCHSYKSSRHTRFIN